MPDAMSLTKYSPLLLLLTAGLAWGKDLDRREKTARAACLSGDYTKGVAMLSELFVETEDAVFIYDQGRCFQQNRRCEEAIARFEEYLRVGKKLSKRDKADAQKHIADCQKLVTKPEAAPAVLVQQASNESKERAAKKACLTGDATAGAAILADLYLDTNNPTYLFNQARCLEQNHRYQEAIDRFREYLEKAKDLDTQDHADTRRHIANCEAYLQARPAEGAKPEAVAVAVVVDSKPPEGIVASTAPSDGQAGGGLRVAGSVVAGVGVAGLVTGLVLDLKVRSMSHDLETNWNSQTNASRKDYATAGWVAYGAGAWSGERCSTISAGSAGKVRSPSRQCRHLALTWPEPS
jgi:tetratricopeptide (TPR) repeat protein